MIAEDTFNIEVNLTVFINKDEKGFNLVETDKKKYEVTKVLLTKINSLIVKIKEDKKYSLQKSISLGLRKLMHKKDFIANVRVNIIDDVMDIDLLDKNDSVIDKYFAFDVNVNHLKSIIKYRNFICVYISFLISFFCPAKKSR